ncbi:hypothetical protein PILCRDRAFT_813050 [Piloderma croceum F 1598]|uniref:Nickel/cobalt efflux system n=1 Tax=Piloderma croceum (strain F 1598) TaxID=765440 RepID=A0A0C3CHA9_PILCF|nr:hypothetical protein PILCRDRAFT_813050 [Piloderma croceum F 1598]
MYFNHDKERKFWLILPPAPRLTLFGRSLLLIVSELLANACCWIVAGILFGKHDQTRSVLSLALLAWTIGLRHALDADHISAIDNATRGLISLGQLPVTCGLFFSLGHSTIVIVVNIAIAISTDIYDKIEGVGNVGAIVGAAVSGSFLFIIGLANSIILWRIIRQRRLAAERRARCLADRESPVVDNEDELNGGKHNNMLMMRLLGPIIHFVDRPWKMYPVGVLFGFGFDTASSIALLALSAIAKKSSDGKQIPPGYIIVLPLLFTASMTLVDSIDSILMLYSYSGFPERSWAIFERAASTEDQGVKPYMPELEEEIPNRAELPHPSTEGNASPSINVSETDEVRTETRKQNPTEYDALEVVEQDTQLKSDFEVNATVREDRVTRNLLVKRNTMSGLSIILTLMSIIVAFSISILTIMGLIGNNCRLCREAASAQDGHGGGLAGSWWRFWTKANDNSGLIGAGIVGSFILVVSAWYIARLVGRRSGAKRARRHIRQGLVRLCGSLS